jgi:hypothetical protein
MESVGEAYKRGGVREALNARGLLTPHEVLRIYAKEKFKKAGYRIVSRAEAPDFIERAGSPSIIAEKNGSWVLVEVKPLDQLVRYEQTGVKLVLVTNLEKGRRLVPRSFQYFIFVREVVNPRRVLKGLRYRIPWRFALLQLYYDDALAIEAKTKPRHHYDRSPHQLI